MRLRFPELKNAANSLQKLLDDEFLSDKWGNVDTTLPTPLPLESKHHPSMKMIHHYHAYSPFLDDSLESKSNQKVQTLLQFIQEIFRNPALKKKFI